MMSYATSLPMGVEKVEPRITVFGSCRVVTPCQILAEKGKIKLNQQNIFGFTHHVEEIFQQFRLLTGDVRAPSRLWPFINIPQHWKSPEPGRLEDFHRLFSETDLFVIEVSSVRKIVFKAFILQINRTRELLADDLEDVRRWWEPMVRYGVNEKKNIPEKLTGTLREVAEIISVYEQSTAEVLRDLGKILNFVKKPVLLVPHFDTTRDRQRIPQRTKIIDAMKGLKDATIMFDPTPYVLEAGIDVALMDLGHYTKEFEIEVSNLIGKHIEQRLCTHAASKP